MKRISNHPVDQYLGRVNVHTRMYNDNRTQLIRTWEGHYALSNFFFFSKKNWQNYVVLLSADLAVVKTFSLKEVKWYQVMCFFNILFNTGLLWLLVYCCYCWKWQSNVRFFQLPWAECNIERAMKIYCWIIFWYNDHMNTSDYNLVSSFFRRSFSCFWK